MYSCMYVSALWQEEQAGIDGVEETRWSKESTGGRAGRWAVKQM